MPRRRRAGAPAALLCLLGPAAALVPKEYRFRFTATRAAGSMLQLQEIRLYNATDGLIDVQALLDAGNAALTVSNGSSPAAHPPSNLFDGDV